MPPHDKPIARFFASLSAKSAGLLKYLTAAIFIFIPLYPKFPLFFLPGSAVAIRAEDFLIGFTTVILVVHLLLTRKFKLPPLGFQVLVYLAIGALSVLSALLITKNVNPLLTIFHWARRLEYLLVFFFAYYVGRESWSSRRFLFQLILLPAIGVFLYGIAQLYFQAPVISTMNTEFAKGIALTLQPGVMLSSTFAGHYDLAIYLIMIMAYISSLLTFTKKKIHLTGLLLGFITLLWILTQTGSRIAIFGLVFSISLICFLRKRLALGIILVFLVGASILTSPNLMARLGNLFRVFQSKVQTSLVIRPVFAAETLRPIQQDRSTSIRFDIEWPRALRSFYKNPILGTGYSSITLATDNEYLRALGETGLLGFAAFIAVLIALGRGLYYRYLKAGSNLDKIIALGTLGAFSAFLISAIFLDVFEASKIAILFWAFTGLAMSTKS